MQDGEHVQDPHERHSVCGQECRFSPFQRIAMLFRSPIVLQLS